MRLSGRLVHRGRDGRRGRETKAEEGRRDGDIKGLLEPRAGVQQQGQRLSLPDEEHSLPPTPREGWLLGLITLSQAPSHTPGAETDGCQPNFQAGGKQTPLSNGPMSLMLIWARILKAIMKEGGWLEKEINPQG